MKPKLTDRMNRLIGGTSSVGNTVKKTPIVAPKMPTAMKVGVAKQINSPVRNKMKAPTIISIKKRF